MIDTLSSKRNHFNERINKITTTEEKGNMTDMDHSDNLNS